MVLKYLRNIILIMSNKFTTYRMSKDAKKLGRVRLYGRDRVRDNEHLTAKGVRK